MSRSLLRAMGRLNGMEYAVILTLALTGVRAVGVGGPWWYPVSPLLLWLALVLVWLGWVVGDAAYRAVAR